VPAEERTDEEGRFAIEAVTPGAYTLSVSDLTVSNEGRDRLFEVETGSVRLIDVRSGVQEIEIRLPERVEGCCEHHHDHGEVDH